MAIYEKNGQLTYVDENGNEYILYPETNIGQVNGLEEALNNKAPGSHTTDENNPHGVTASQVGARPNTWMPSAADVGARPNTWMPSAADVGAMPKDSILLNGNENLNALVDEGEYYYGWYNETIINAPVHSAFHLSVKKVSAAEVSQTYTQFTGGYNVIYTRQSSNNKTSWSVWNKIYDTANKPTPADIGAVNKNGDTMNGRLGTSGLDIYDSDWAQMIRFFQNNIESGLIYRQNSNGALTMGSKHPNSSAKEYYFFNAPNEGMTADVWHEILTTKNPIWIHQGGTGATNDVDARYNLGLPYFRTYYFESDTMLNALKNNYNSISNGACIIYAKTGYSYVAVVGYKVDNHAAFLELWYADGSLYKYWNVNGTWSQCYYSHGG